MKSDSFFWFDYETYGISPAWDKPAQFAGQRTTLNLEPVGDPVVYYCKPPMDYLPSPEACRVTGLLPDEIASTGEIEPHFIAKVVAQLGFPGTCSVGYNSIRFDDEFTRHTLFRNFHDPYEYEWKDGNSRWDLLDVVRLARALRPDGIQWPTLDDGTPTNKLELLSQANGIAHEHAHDALSDVQATIGMAKLIKEKQPRLYDYALKHRDKKSVAAILNYRDRRPCVHVSGMIPGSTAHTSIVIPVARHPVNQNGVIVLDLRTDPDALFSLSQEDIAHRVFSGKDDLADDDRIHLRVIHINKCPVLVPIQTMRPADAERIGIDLSAQLARAESFKHSITDAFAETVRQAMTREWDSAQQDVDGSLYSGHFFGEADKTRFRQIRDAAVNKPSSLASLAGFFDDDRLDELLFRYRARHFPDTLNPEEKTDWIEHCKDRLTTDSAPWLTVDAFNTLMQNLDWRDDEARLKQSLLDHAETVISQFRD